MSAVAHGWQRLLNITDNEIRRANEDTIDELYAFLLTNRINDTAVSEQPNDLRKILGTIQTILRLKDAEFQEMFTAYEENQKSPSERERENERLKQLLSQQEARIHQLETSGGGLGGGTNIREVTVLRQEVDELRGQLTGTRNRLERERIEKDKLTRELSSECQKGRELEVEMILKKEEVEGYRNKLSAQSMSGVMGLVEEELRERLKVQEREMAEQLDRMEELISDRQRLDQKLVDLEKEVQQSEEERVTMNEAILKHQDVLNQADDSNKVLQTEMQKLSSDIEHSRDQLNNQMNINKQLTEIIEKERSEYQKETQLRSETLGQYQQKLVQVENQLKMLLQDTNKSHVVKLTKELSDNHSMIEQLQKDLLESTEKVSSLTSQLEEANRLHDPEHVNNVLSQEIKSLQLKLNESESLLKMEKDRRLQVEEEKERCDIELVDARQRLEDYETGHIGLREAVIEIKQRKNELAQRDSEIAKLIQQVNKLQTQTDTLYDENEAFRHRLGLGPNDNIDLEEIRNCKEKELNSLQEDNNALSMNIVRLEEEKLILRKKLVEKTFPTSSATPADSLSNSKTTLSPDHMMMADLNGQISHLQSLLETERKRKEACQKEIARLSKELVTAVGDGRKKQTSSGAPRRPKSLGGSLLSIEETDYDANKIVVLKHENQILQQKLKEVVKHSNQSMTANGRGVMEVHPRHMDDVGSGVFDWKGSEKQSPYIESGVSQDHLLMIMRELREREQSLANTREQLEQFRRKFTIIIHQQGVVYKEYHDAKSKWGEEKQTYQRKMEGIELQRDQNMIKLEELERLQSTLINDPDITKQKLGEMSRRLTKLRVNERTLLRRCSLLETSQTGLRKEVSVLKQSANDIQLHYRQQLTYLQRYKDAACYKISSFHKQLSESVPLIELDETRKSLSTLTNQYQALLASLVATETGDTGNRIRELSLALSESRMREEKLTEQINESTDSKHHRELENIISTLENTIGKLKQENSRVKQRADMSEQQLEFIHNKKEEKEREMEILQQQNIELSTTSDHKAAIGQLQQQILALKQNEANSVNQLQLSQSKVQEIQTQLLQTLQQSGEKEDAVEKVKTQSTARIRRLNCIMLSYQRKFTGATLLPDQEKLYSLLSKAKQNEEKTNTKLMEVEEETVRIRDRCAELLVQQRNLQELIAILKDGKEAGFVNKITEWHSKLGEMRLKELQQQRTNNRLEEKIRHLREQVISRERDVTILEQKLVQTDKNLEDILFCFDDSQDNSLKKSEKRKPVTTRDQETLATDEPKDKQQSHFVETITRLQSDILNYETRIRQLETVLSKTEDQLLNTRRGITESEETVTNKNNTIMELEQRINSLEERIVHEGKEKQTSSQKTIKLATDTLEQLQTQLLHKEGQLERYQQLLQECKREHFTVQENQRQEIDKLRKQIELLNQRLVNQHEMDHHDMLMSNDQDKQSVGDQYLHIKELQDIVRNLEESNEILNEQLQQRTAAWEGERREIRTREEERKKDNHKMKMKYNLQIKELQGTLTVKNGRVHDLEEELEITKVELATAMESATKSPSKSLQGLVEKLRVQLTEKERQLEGLKKALQQVRTDLVETAQRTIESQSRQDTVQYNVQKMINDRMIEVKRGFESRIKELSDELMIKEQLLETKAKEVGNYQREHEKHKEKLNKIEKDLHDRTVELEESENSLKQVQRQLKENMRNEERSKRELEQQLSSNNGELVELRERCLLLQSRVNELTMSQQVERKANIGHINNKHSSVEVARWEEGKKWQKKIDTVKMKLSERNKELEICQKQVTSLRDIIRRTEREKGLLQERLRSEKEVKRTDNSSVAAGTVTINEIHALKTRIYEQNNQITELKKQIQEQKSEVIKQLEEENQLLRQSYTALQSEMKSFEHETTGGSWLAHETHLRQELLQTKKQHTQLQFKHEQMLLEVPRLRSRIDELQCYVQVLKSGPGHHEGSGHHEGTTVSTDTKKGTYTANEVEKVVSAMKKVIERLQNENDSLKKNNRKHSKKDIELENQRLKDELEKTRQTLASLGESRDGDTPLMTVIAENDRLRAELKKEVEKTEKRVSDISRMKIEKSRLKEKLTEFSEPQESLIRERQELREENMKLRTELEAFDSRFFEEIEDLKYNYQEAVKKNVEYEEHIQLLASEYGLKTLH